MSLVLDEHREYLSDAPRVAAFRRAIHATVRPGDVVLDLACGTGILGLMACEAGASRVYAIDDGGILEIAKRVAQENGVGDRITHVAGHSTHVELPRRADVLVFDQIGRLGFDAGVLELAADARKRLLQPDARIVPGPIHLDVALVSSPVMRERVDFWESRPAGFAFSSASSTARNTGYPMKPSRAELCSAPAHAVIFDPARWSGEALTARLQLAAARDAAVDGLCGWFRAELAPGVWMTNAPGAADRINRRPAFLPFDARIGVKAGETFDVRIDVLPANSILVWDVSRAGARERHSTWRGMLPVREEIARTRPDAAPVLSARGRARGTVLELCDGRRTVREIEAGLRARHPDLFTESGTAETFVAEVLAVYGRV